MSTRMIIEYRKHLIAVYLIEARCLETVRLKDDVMTATGSHFLLRRLYQSGAISLTHVGLYVPTGQGCSNFHPMSIQGVML